MKHDYYDLLLIGGGAAGLSLALHLAPHIRIGLITKGPLTEGATYYAQGGISAVWDQADSLESHIEDTLNAGAGLCDPAVVRYTVEHARDAIQWLVEQGVPFTRETRPDGSSDYHLTREGGHSHRRILHAADTTGRSVELTLEQQARRHPNIEVLENHIAIDLITGKKLGLAHNHCWGAYVLDRDAGQVKTLRAKSVVLATGGAGKVYIYSSNPDVCTGDGIAMAWRAGCRVANMEFIQFHPTCLYHPRAKFFLISEAVRGEGGRILLPDGTPFLDKFDPIDHEMKRLGAEFVYLDISHKPADFIKSHFPSIYSRCLELGFDMTKEPLPVVPATHYTCGGVMIDLRGRTDLEGLYAIGETAYSGLHGANRMASNSLLECLVFGQAAAEDIKASVAAIPPPPAVPEWDESRVTDSDEEVVVAHNWEELRRFMWDYVGIVRSDKRLQRAKHRIDLLLREIDDYYGHFRVTNDLIELRNLAMVADLIIRSAMLRKESRGLHYTLDYPVPDDSRPPHNTVLMP